MVAVVPAVPKALACNGMSRRGVEVEAVFDRHAAAEVSAAYAILAPSRRARVRAGEVGPIEALPADVQKTTAIKNGWPARDDGQWHIACMAVGDGWSLGIMAYHPSSPGKDYGVKTCREVTKHLLTPH
jgi:hypothetical protein